MNAIKLVMLVFIASAACAAACYLAGCAYFLIAKAVPTDLHVDTWLRYWSAYSKDPVQRPRLLAAAAIAVASLGAGTIALCVSIGRTGRQSLHGDARWASAAEIRKAGLL